MRFLKFWFDLTTTLLECLQGATVNKSWQACGWKVIFWIYAYAADQNSLLSFT